MNYANRYQRAAKVIHASLNRNARLPSVAQLMKKADVTQSVAEYILMAWNAYHCDAVFGVANPNRYHRAGWAIRRSLKRTGSLPSVDSVATQCAMSQNIAHACLRAWDAFQVAA